MDAVKRLEGGLPPPPPAGSTLVAPPVKEQRERIREAMEEAHVMRPGDVFFPVSAIWWDHWRRFVDYDEDGQAAPAAAPAQGHHHHVQQARSGDEELHPGRMDNTALAAEEGSRELSREIVEDNDYVLLPEGAYTLLKEWYAGGPYAGGPDFPRRAVEVGEGAARETRVRLYPYFVACSAGDSPYHVGTARERRGGEELMLDTATPVTRFVKELCRATGVDPQYADVFLVSELAAPPGAEGPDTALQQGEQQQQEQQQQPPQPPPLPLSLQDGMVRVECLAASTAEAPAPPPPSSSSLQSSPSLAPAAAPTPTKVYELRKLARHALVDPALVLEDFFHGQTRLRIFVENRRWRYELKIGDTLDACDDDEAWYDSVVVSVIQPRLPPAPPAIGLAAARGGAGTAVAGPGAGVLPHIKMQEADADGSAGANTDTAKTRAAGWRSEPEGEDEEARQPKVMVHFRCWEKKWDAEVAVTSPRLQPLFTLAPDWRRFRVGMILAVKSQRDRKWYRGKVLEVREAERRVLVSSEGDVAPASSITRGGGISDTGGSAPLRRERWYSFDSEDICRSNVHFKDAPPPSPSPTPSPPGADPSSSSTPSLAGSKADGGVGGGGGFGGGQGYVLGSGAGAAGGPATTPLSSARAGGGLSLSLSSGGAYGGQPRRAAGVVGLQNLGNTCFMNSMLQCLSNTGVLTEYFLGGKHEAEVNEANPLGMKGMLARVYARLLQSMWRGESSPVSPVELKRVISQFAPLFAGYQQHDSQELMNFLLDGLHEDLNRVLNKPYVEAKDYNGEPDSVLAAESWRRHLLRNDSIVVDHCQGQFRSHLTCPKCGYESVCFDPYLNLTLPIPVTSMVRVAFVFHPLPLGSTPLHAAATVPAAGTGRALKAWIAANLCKPRGGVPGADAVVVEPADGRDEDRGGNGGGPPGCPPAGCINLAETLEKTRLYQDIEDKTPLSELARPALSLHAYELELPATVIPLQQHAAHIPTGGKGLAVVASRWGAGRSTPSPPPPEVRAGPASASAAAAAAGHEAEVALVTLQFVKVGARSFMSLGGGKSYDRFGMPVQFALPMGPSTTNAVVHARVWEAAKRFLKDEALTEAGRRPYALLLGNTPATAVEATPVPDDAEPFAWRALQGRVLLAAFEPAEYMDYVDADLLQRVEAHASVRRASLDGSGNKRKAIDLRQCLEKFAEREQLGEDDLWHCGRCKERLQAHKKMDVWSLPDVLILHLKRFSYVRTGLSSSFYSHKREKIEDLVTFPLEGLDLSDVMRGPVDPAAPPVYDLQAVSEHVGGLGGGHYTAVARNFESGKWYSFNDSYVAPIDPARLQETVVTPRAYVLFYKRRTGSLRWAGAKPHEIGGGGDGDMDGTDGMDGGGSG